MRTHKFAIASVALVASTILISCSSDDNNAPADSGVPIVAGSTIASTPLSDGSVAPPLNSTAP